MVKILHFNKDGIRTMRASTKDSFSILDQGIINYFSRILEKGGSWKLEFINTDPREEARWKSCEAIAMFNWQSDSIIYH